MRKDYFVSQSHALEARKQLEGDKDSDTTKQIFENIGSKVDFMQLIKSLVNDDSITVLRYNEDLANIVSNPTVTEVIQAQMLDDMRKLAEKSNDEYLQGKIHDFEKHLEELRQQKEEAERKAEEERIKAEIARKTAQEEKEKRIQVQKELEQKKKQNLFLLSVGTLDKDRILKYHHDIRIHTATIRNTVAQILKKAYQGVLTTEEAVKTVERISRANDKINSIAQFATKANYSIDADEISADIVNYISDYVNNVLPEFYGEYTLHCEANSCSKVLKFAPLEASLFIDNLISNAVKFNARHFDISFSQKDDLINMVVTDDGDGLSDKVTYPNSIFEKGFTTTNGSGLGLYNVADFVKNVLKGTVTVGTDNATSGFKLIINFK